MNPLTLPRQNTEAELRAFETVCDRMGGFNPDIATDWVDGFLAALAAGPRVPAPDVWLALMCGDVFERTFADPEDATQALHTLKLRLKVLCDQLDPAALMESPESLRLNPVMAEWTDADRARLVAEGAVSAEEAQSLQTGSLWAEGFADAVEALPDLWEEPVDEESAVMFGQLLDQIVVLMVPPQDDEFKAHVARYYPQGDPTRDEMLAEACWAAQDLRMYWLDRSPKPATRRVEATPGRNDPCPCGSGKKYKKCCGA